MISEYLMSFNGTFEDKKWQQKYKGQAWTNGTNLFTWENT